MEYTFLLYFFFDHKQLYLVALEYVNKDLKDQDKNIVIAAVAQDGYALRWAGSIQKKNREVVMAAVSNYGHMLTSLSECQEEEAAFKNDQEIVMAAILQDGCALEGASELFKDNKKIVLIAVEKNGCMT